MSIPSIPTIPNNLKRQLKARAQTLDPILKLGHAGASDAFINSLAQALDDHALVKIRFTDFKEEKKTLSIEIARRTGAELIMRVGNVAVYYREKPSTASTQIRLSEGGAGSTQHEGRKEPRMDADGHGVPD